METCLYFFDNSLIYLVISSFIFISILVINALASFKSKHLIFNLLIGFLGIVASLFYWIFFFFNLVVENPGLKVLEAVTFNIPMMIWNIVYLLLPLICLLIIIFNSTRNRLNNKKLEKI